MDDFIELSNSIETLVDDKKWAHFQWDDGNITDVTATRERDGWEVFCWSRRHTGVDFPDVIVFDRRESAIALYNGTVKLLAELGAVEASLGPAMGPPKAFRGP